MTTYKSNLKIYLIGCFFNYAMHDLLQFCLYLISVINVEVAASLWLSARAQIRKEWHFGFQVQKKKDTSQNPMLRKGSEPRIWRWLSSE